MNELEDDRGRQTNWKTTTKELVDDDERTGRRRVVLPERTRTTSGFAGTDENWKTPERTGVVKLMWFLHNKYNKTH